MGNAAGDDEVLDLSLKKSPDSIIADSTVCSVRHRATHVVRASSSSSSLNTLSVTAVVTVNQQSPGVSLTQLSTSTCCTSSSDMHRTDPLRRTTASLSSAAAALSSSYVATTNCGFQLSFSPSLTHSVGSVHRNATDTAVRYSSSYDPVVPAFTASTAPHTAVMTGSCDSARPRLKRLRKLSEDEVTSRPIPSQTTAQLLLTDSYSSRQSPPSIRHPQSSVTTSESVMRVPQSSDDQSDAAGYVERRRRNNEAAKRSRDARRLKETETAIRAAALERDNLQLRAELALLRNQAAKLHSILYNKLGV